jgi:hypothetical protein
VGAGVGGGGGGVPEATGALTAVGLEAHAEEQPSKATTGTHDGRRTP